MHRENLPPAMDMEWVPCPLCSSTDAEALFIGRDYLLDLPGQFPVTRCRVCQLIYANPRPTLSSLHQFYPDQYGPYQPPLLVPSTDMIKASKLHRLRREIRNALLNLYLEYHLPLRIRWVQHPWLLAFFARIYANGLAEFPAWKEGGTLLEIGCAYGGYLMRMREVGWQVTGVEFSGTTAALARTRFQLEVYSGAFEDQDFPAEGFDVVCLWHVIEHLSAPAVAVRKIHQLLRPGGELLLSTSNASAWLYPAIFGRCWLGWDQPRHRCIFSEETLKRLLMENGFRNIRIRYQTGNTNDLVHSLRALLREYANVPLARQARDVLSVHSQWQHLALLPLASLLEAFKQRARIMIRAERA